MSIDFVEELTWRGMVHDMTPGVAGRLRGGQVTGYAGFDPTAPSLQIGNLVPVMMLLHLQRAGHKPLALLGGATGMIGDPSGKNAERNLLGEEEVRYNIERFREQLSRFLDFSAGPLSAELVNNHDWFGTMGFLEFLREVGKYLTVGSMLSKESVRQRLESGISFTEFSYQLLQGYDYYLLYTTRNCVLQIGGSDQWGNIVAGTELIRRKAGGEAHALTCPLVTRADGTKFGKSAAGDRVWLDPDMTSPYRFYQFWLNCADEDAARFLRVFTTLPREEIEGLEQEHAVAPHLRALQKALAKDITVRVHSQSDYEGAVEASRFLFGAGSSNALGKISERALLEVLEGVPRFSLSRTSLESGLPVLDLVVAAKVFSSRGEARRMIEGGGVSINRNKVLSCDETITTHSLLAGRYLLVQKGKKQYYLGDCA